jgi:hypothetical protein
MQRRAQETARWDAVAAKTNPAAIEVFLKQGQMGNPRAAMVWPMSPINLQPHRERPSLREDR